MNFIFRSFGGGSNNRRKIGMPGVQTDTTVIRILFHIGAIIAPNACFHNAKSLGYGNARQPLNAP